MIVLAGAVGDLPSCLDFEILKQAGTVGAQYAVLWKNHRIIGNCRSCSRACNIASPFLCGIGFTFTIEVALKINSYLFIDGFTKHVAVMRRHKRALQLLEWTSARLDWFLADDSSEELEIDDPQCYSRCGI